MRSLDSYPLDELKLAYRVLHKGLLAHIELMDSELLSDLQSHLREAAALDGVDTSDHGAWDAWLDGDAAPPRPQRGGLTLLEGGQP